MSYLSTSNENMDENVHKFWRTFIKIRVSMVMEAKQGVEMSEGRNIQKKIDMFR